MASATDLNALHNGNFTLVLGEVHMAINTMDSEMFVTQYPTRQTLFPLWTRTFPSPACLWCCRRRADPSSATHRIPATGHISIDYPIHHFRGREFIALHGGDVAMTPTLAALITLVFRG